MATQDTFDVIVIGTGNAGLSAAASAAQTLQSQSSPGRPSVLVLEKAPEAWAGGNTTFTAGAYRTAFAGLKDVLPLVHNVESEEHASRIDMEAYSADNFLADLKRVTGGRSDSGLANTLTGESRETTQWLHDDLGVRFVLSFNRQAYEVDGRFKFWGGMVLAVEDGGKGLVRMLLKAVKQLGVEVRYENAVTGLKTDEFGRVMGVTVQTREGAMKEIFARGGVVLAAGGFEANAQMRAAHIGPGWDLAYVRGTPYNTGDLLQTCIAPSGNIGALPAGNWSGCHSTCWDFNAPTDIGDQKLTNQFTKSGYPLGVMINSSGNRFVDEGEDMRNYTYAKFGRAILGQPESMAFQVWDADGTAWLREEEYAPDVVERITAGTLDQLAEKLLEKGLKSKSSFLATCNEYNTAVQHFKAAHPDHKFDPSIKDKLSTLLPNEPNSGLRLGPNKTNWALPITKAPFLAVKVTCGITFTFGGLKTCPDTAAVISARTQRPVQGLYVAGEMVGGLFYGNYPGGSGLTSGAVFGRKAGREAAKRAKRMVI
jgi:precorrin 3B synthase CobZ